MSLSQIPNLPHPHLPPPSIPATAAVTRILVLSNFSPALKTRDLQAAFAQWEADKGGFRIKWIDDVTALVVFQDANVAKRAYLSILLNPAPALPPPALIKPYDGPDAQAIIHSVTARQHGHAGPGGRTSMSGAAAGLTSGSMAGVVNAGFGGFAQGSMGGGGMGQGIAGYGQGPRNQAKAQQPPTGDALMGLGNSNYGRHARSASTSSISASEPVHGRNVSGSAPGNQGLGGGNGNGNGVGRIGGAHARHGSSGSSAFGRNSAMGAFSFGGNPSTGQSKDGLSNAQSPGDTTYTLPPVSSSAAFRSQPLGGLATHHEGESPSGTPLKSPATARPFVPESSSSSNNHNPSAAYVPNHEDASTPGIEILGAVPFPEGGPGGYLASKERRASGGGSPATSAGGGGGAAKKTSAGFDVLGGIRRESLDAKSAEKALREVSKALEGLGVGVVAAGAGKV